MTVQFNARCIANYVGEIELPEDINVSDTSEVLAYILDNLSEVSCEELEYVDDTEDPVTEDDILYIGD